MNKNLRAVFIDENGYTADNEYRLCKVYDHPAFTFGMPDSGLRVIPEEVFAHLPAQEVKRLSDEDGERIMVQWDYWREQIAKGNTSSAPRDWFESIVDQVVIDKQGGE